MGDVAFQLRIKKWSKHYDPENKKKKADDETSADIPDVTPEEAKSDKHSQKRRNPLIGSAVVQNIASQVWRKFETFFFGDGKELRFIPWQNFCSLEGKPTSKEKGLIKLRGTLAFATDFEEARKIAEKIAYKEVNSPDGSNISFYRSTKELSVNGMRIQVLVPDKPYETEALKNRIKYCRVIRIPWRKCWLYKLQLVMEGIAPFKTIKKRIQRGKNEVIIVDDSRHPLGINKGRIGLDMGPRTLAYVSANAVGLKELADKADNPERKIAALNRSLDQSRRAKNPEYFDAENKTIIPREQLKKSNPELLDKNENYKWKNTVHYEELSQLRRYYYARAARTRRCQHQTMANMLMQLGDEFFIEDVKIQSWAKRKKKKEQKPETKKQNIETKQTTSQVVSTTFTDVKQSGSVIEKKSEIKEASESSETKKPKRNRSRRRFGKSVGNKAPGMFISILQQKVKYRGGSFIKLGLKSKCNTK